MKVISYNLRKHRAVDELAHLCELHDPDVLCLQEADTLALPPRVGELALAQSTTRNRLGLAVYYRDEHWVPTGVRAVALKKSMHDRVLRPAHERLVGVRFRDNASGREFIVASFHAAPLTALNSLRRHQIRAALLELQLLGPGLPTLMVGDYNYPIFKDNLTEKVRDHGYELTLSDARTYTRYKFFRGHYDFATSVGFDIDTIATLPQGASDHLPILVTAQLEDVATVARVAEAS